MPPDGSRTGWGPFRWGATMTTAFQEWPSLPGEMARLVRDFDWRTSPVGPCDEWPTSLRHAVELMLRVPQVASIAVGPDRILLYNDLAAADYGSRHPMAFGRRIAQTFADRFDQISDCYDRVFAGEAVRIPARSGDSVGTKQPHHYDAYVTPVYDRGEVIAAFSTFVSAADRLRAEVALEEVADRNEFLLGLSDVLRQSSDTSDITYNVAKLLAGRLLAKRAFYVEWCRDAGYCEVRRDFSLPELRSLAGRYDMQAFRIGALAAGTTWVVEDVSTEVDLSDSERRCHSEVGVAAWISVPLIKNGELLATLSVMDDCPREWTPSEIALVEDVAERCRDAIEQGSVELQLRDSEERFRSMAEAVEDVFYLIDLERDELIYLSPRYEDVWGWPAEKIMADLGTFVDTIHPGDQGIAVDAKAAQLRGEQVTVEYRVVRNDGEIRWILDRSFPVVGASGRRLAGIATDITDRRLAEHKARESDLRFRQLVESIRDYAIFTVSIDGTITSWPSGAESVFGWSEAEMLGRNVAETFVPEDVLDGAPAFEMETALHEGVAPNVRWHLRKDGRRIFIQGSLQALASTDGKIRELIKIGQDVTEQRHIQEALAASENRYRLALQVGRIGSWETNFETGVRRWSPEGMALFGLDLPEGRGQVGGSGDEWRAALHPDERHFPDQLLSDLARMDQREVEYRIVRPDGKVAWLHGHLQVLERDNHGSVVRSINVAADITARRQAEADLRESETRLRQFGEASQDVLWLRDAMTLEWQYLTPAFETVYGLPRPAPNDRDTFSAWLDLILPEDRQHACNAISRVVAGETVTFEYRIRRPADGTIRWLRDTDFPIADAEGRVVLIGGIGHDFTEVRETELRMRVLMEGIPQLVWRAHDGGGWSWASAQWLDYTGQTVAESLGHGWIAAIHLDDRERVHQAWTGAVDKLALEAECRIRQAKDGTYRWFKIRASPVRAGSGRIIEWLGTCTDIHELRSLQERQQVLVSELQHRTRNLMGVVRAVSEKTVRTSANLEDFQERYSDRLEALSRVQGLLSRLEDYDRVTFDELIRAELMAINGDQDRISISGPMGVRLRSSTVQILAMAIHELATNAVKYGALGQPAARLVISWHVERGPDDSRPWLHIVWAESGVITIPDRPVKPGAGQGRELIERALPHQLGARTSFAIEQDGVRCTIAVPVSMTALSTTPEA